MYSYGGRKKIPLSRSGPPSTAHLPWGQPACRARALVTLALRPHTPVCTQAGLELKIPNHLPGLPAALRELVRSLDFLPKSRAAPFQRYEPHAANSAGTPAQTRRTPLTPCKQPAAFTPPWQTWRAIFTYFLSFESTASAERNQRF